MPDPPQYEHFVDELLTRLAMSCKPERLTTDEAAAARRQYIREWADIAPDLLALAVDQWLAEANPFFPTPGQIRKMAYDLLTLNEPDAFQAWAEVKRAIHATHIDLDPQPTFSSDRIRMAVESIGWRNLCTQSERDEIANRAHFTQAYNALSARIERAALMKPESRQRLRQVQEQLRLTAGRMSLPRLNAPASDKETEPDDEPSG